jgi:hypothetical protein
MDGQPSPLSYPLGLLNANQCQELARSRKLMQQLERDWVGAVSGKLGQQSDNGFEVVDAGIKVFEKLSRSQRT